MSQARQSQAATSLQRVEPAEDAGVREFLAFVVAHETYALPLSCIREIMRVPSVTPVPRAPHDVLGIISVRGQVTTLIDLRQRLRVQAGPVSSRTRVLLVDQGDEIMGLLCDRVQQVHRLSEKEVELASVLGSDAASYVMGIGRPGQHKPEARKKREKREKRESSAEPAERDELTERDERDELARAARAAKRRADDNDADILILLDPIALLKRQVNHV